MIILAFSSPSSFIIILFPDPIRSRLFATSPPKNIVPVAGHHLRILVSNIQVISERSSMVD